MYICIVMSKSSHGHHIDTGVDHASCHRTITACCRPANAAHLFEFLSVDRFVQFVALRLGAEPRTWPPIAAAAQHPPSGCGPAARPHTARGFCPEDGGLQIQTFPTQHMTTIAVKNTGAAYTAAAPAPRPAQPKAKGRNKQPPAGIRLAAAIRTVKGAMNKIRI